MPEVYKVPNLVNSFPFDARVVQLIPFSNHSAQIMFRLPQTVFSSQEIIKKCSVSLLLFNVNVKKRNVC